MEYFLHIFCLRIWLLLTAFTLHVDLCGEESLPLQSQWACCEELSEGQSCEAGTGNGLLPKVKRSVRKANHLRGRLLTTSGCPHKQNAGPAEREINLCRRYRQLPTHHKRNLQPLLCTFRI